MLKILVVDDDNEVRQKVVAYLKSPDFKYIDEVVEADCLATALRAFEEDAQREIKVIITDLNLGNGGTGTELAQQVYNLKRADVVIILMSTSDLELQDVADFGIKDFWPKHWIFKQIAERLKMLAEAGAENPDSDK